MLRMAEEVQRHEDLGAEEVAPQRLAVLQVVWEGSVGQGAVLRVLQQASERLLEVLHVVGQAGLPQPVVQRDLRQQEGVEGWNWMNKMLELNEQWVELNEQSAGIEWTKFWNSTNKVLEFNEQSAGIQWTLCWNWMKKVLELNEQSAGTKWT